MRGAQEYGNPDVVEKGCGGEQDPRTATPDGDQPPAAAQVWVPCGSMEASAHGHGSLPSRAVHRHPFIEIDCDRAMRVTGVGRRARAGGASARRLRSRTSRMPCSSTAG